MDRANNTEKPIISIITPVYNVEKYLNRCVESIVNQTFHSFELILIDDGSKDKSSLLCDEWAQKDSRIIVVHQKNAGAGAARNHGLQIAKGDYIGFVDSDDWIEPNMYELLLTALIENPDVEMAECETHRTRGNDLPHNTNQEIATEVLSQEQLLKLFFRVEGGESNYGIITKLLKREVIKDFSFIEGTISEDVMASYYFYTHCNKAVMIHKKLYNYFQNQSGVTRKKVTKRDFEYIEAFRRIHEDIKRAMPKLQRYSEINYIRANFTILSKMKLVGFDKSDPELLERYKTMKAIVKKNFVELMRWKMPLSRKVLLIWVCM